MMRMHVMAHLTARQIHRDVLAYVYVQGELLANQIDDTAPGLGSARRGYGRMAHTLRGARMFLGLLLVCGACQKTFRVVLQRSFVEPGLLTLHFLRGIC